MRKEILALITIFLFATNLSAQCTGSEFCSTCTNCSKCKHCKGTGYCGACEPNRFKTKEKNTAIKKAEEEKNKMLNKQKIFQNQKKILSQLLKYTLLWKNKPNSPEELLN